MCKVPDFVDFCSSKRSYVCDGTRAAGFPSRLRANCDSLPCCPSASGCGSGSSRPLIARQNFARWRGALLVRLRPEQTSGSEIDLSLSSSLDCCSIRCGTRSSVDVQRIP